MLALGKSLLYSQVQMAFGSVLWMNRAEKEFKRILEGSEVSKKAASELWKWYDPTEKKGVASF